MHRAKRARSVSPHAPKDGLFGRSPAAGPVHTCWPACSPSQHLDPASSWTATCRVCCVPSESLTCLLRALLSHSHVCCLPFESLSMSAEQAEQARRYAASHIKPPTCTPQCILTQPSCKCARAYCHMLPPRQRHVRHAHMPPTRTAHLSARD